MATLPTPEEQARIVLSIFAHFSARPGHALRPNNFVAVAANRGIPMQDITGGLEHGEQLGWFENGPNGSIKLTATGFAEM